MYQDLVGKCRAQEGASDADIQEMAAHQPPSTSSGKCLNACIMESVGIVRKSLLPQHNSSSCNSFFF